MRQQWKTKLVLMLAFGLLGFGAQAYAKAYRIELIVFAQQDATNEVFDQYQSQIRWPSALRPLSAYSPAGKSLTGVWSRLANSADYRPLLHVAWIQRVGKNRLGTAVKIQNGPINGFFRLQRGNLLHFIADFEYQPDGGVLYHIQEKRRFKLNEIHYLDHPEFGLIIRVSPL